MSDSSIVATLPPRGRLAGVDHGDVRVGLAVCDAEQKWSSAVEQYQRRTTALDAEWFVAFAKREGIVGWVVGLPTLPSGNDTAQTQKVREFGRWLAEVSNLPVRMFDERYTSRMAEETLIAAQVKASKRKALRDKLAAQILLASYLERDPSRDGAGRSHSENSSSLDD